MEKKLPGVFANRISKKIDNNKTVFYGSKEGLSEETKKEKKSKLSSKDLSLNIKQKINQIFQSEHYIYKIDVEIVLKDKKIKKRLVGYNDRNLITFDNELIPINDVLDIKIVKEG